MKKQLWPGVGLGIFMFLATLTFAGSLKDTTELSPLSQPSSAASNLKPTGPYRDRMDTNSQEIQARWHGMDARNGAEIMGFSSTSAAQAAASLLQNQGYSLSFSSFGRAPFQQLLMVSKDGKVNSSTTTSSRPVTALPEPTTLLLLGSGLAALAAGLSKGKRK